MITREIRHMPDGTVQIIEREIDDAEAARAKAAFEAKLAARQAPSRPNN